MNGIRLPEVTPAVSSPLPGFRLCKLSSHTDAPTQSKTASTPRPLVSSLTRWLKAGVVVELIRSSAASFLPFSRFRTLPAVASSHAPKPLPISKPALPKPAL
jgi:hypothetical protein